MRTAPWLTGPHPPPCPRVLLHRLQPQLTQFLLVLLLLLSLLSPAACRLTSVDHYQTAEFLAPHDNGSLRLLAVNVESQDVYVGAVDYIYSLTKDLVQKVEVKTGPAKDNVKCPPPVLGLNRTRCGFQKKDTHNFIKVLLVDYVDKKLISCGTLFHGYCKKYHLDDIRQSDQPSSEKEVAAVVSSSTNTSTVAFIAPGPSPSAGVPQPNVLYVSVTWSPVHPQVIEIPAFSSRNLSDFSIAYKQMNSFTSTGIGFNKQQREHFIVNYVYGFGSENFSYLLTVQRNSTDTDKFGYHSVMVRVCQNDKDYYSYTEVPIVCKADGVEYNLLQAAYLAKAGRKLALDLQGLTHDTEITTQTGVLYGVFSTSKGASSDKPTTSSALCVFPMRSVRSKFTENIKRCFNGTGMTGGAHLQKPLSCTRNTDQEFTITDEYCGSESNQPLAGALPIEAELVLELPPSTPLVSALGVAVTDEYTVAFVGTKNGTIVKMSVGTGRPTNVYETVSVFSGQEVKKDLNFDEEQSHLYVLSEKKVIKMKVADCSVHTTCSDCLGAGDPYCGWCSLDFKCSKHSDCQRRDNPKGKGWLAFDEDKCPAIGQLQPKRIPRDKRRMLTFNIKHLTEFPQPQQYQCVFSSLSDVGTYRNITVATRVNGNKFQCDTPKTDHLPTFADGRDSIKLKFGVHIDNKELVHDVVTFYDCKVHSNCMACAMSEFTCTWCIKSHLCTDEPALHCRGDEHVAGTNSTGNVANAGPAFCPRFESRDGSTEILVPAGADRRIQVRAHALHKFQTDQLRCQFRFNNIEEVAATAEKEQQADGSVVYIITCENKKFTYIRASRTMDVLFNIVWGADNPNPLDNTQGVSVVMYKCSAMAATCGDCITVMPKFECGWCSTDKGWCTTNGSCTTATFLERGAICTNPYILSFQPKSGPVKGGTEVTITGQNLGSHRDEVKVHISTVTCEIIKFRPPNMTVCRTQKSTGSFESEIMISVGHNDITGGYGVQGRSKEKFAFVNPRITGIYPDEGPYAGGTVVTILGEHMDAGSKVSVQIGKVYPCSNPLSLNSTAMICTTSEEPTSSVSKDLKLTMMMDNDMLKPDVSFSYVSNPNITWVSRRKLMRSGGLQVNASGENLKHVQNPQMLIWVDGKAYSGLCKFTAEDKNISCFSPNLLTADLPKKQRSELDFGFRMDGVPDLQRLTALGKMTVFPDPLMDKFKDGEKTFQHNTELLFLNGKHLGGVQLRDVQVHVGRVECVVTSVVPTVIMCKPPTEQPAPKVGSGFPQVVVQIGRNKTYELGYLKYEQQQELSLAAMIGIGGGVLLLLVLLLIMCICCVIRFRRNDDMMKKMRKEMDQLESRVAHECKEAFAELQTDMNELASDLSGGTSIPFWDYRTYCMQVLFPQCNDHPVISELEMDYRYREDTERGLKLFFNLIRNKTFLLIFIRTLESNESFSLKDRVNVASLLSVALQTQMEYATDILKTLLAELIEKTVEKPSKPQLLLRRNESVAEKMLTNWFTFLLYKFLKECAGEPLFMLYGAIKQQVSKGPVDAVTSEARYSLSEDKLIRQQINFKSMLLFVMDVDVDRCPQPAHPVKVLDCDSISQVKEKILDAIFKSAPFSSRPPKEELDLEWIVGENKQNIPLKLYPNKDTKRLVLSDEDHTTRTEGDCRRLNTLSHYKVQDGAFVALHPKQTSIYNMTIMSEKSKYSDNSYYNRSPSLNRSVSPNNVHIDLENSRVYHLVRHQDEQSNHKEGERGSKMVTEIYLPRLLVTKGTLQTFVDDLFERIFSTAHRGTALPLAIKYMFDFLDDQAMHHNMPDEVVHAWKSNCLPLRFWVNVMKNPNFAFDVYKSNIVDACLTVIGQTFMDSCSIAEQKLTKDSPSGKLLYAKDIPKYKQWVVRYYQDIKIMPAISDQDMTAMLAEESRSHQNEFNTNAALLELYKYVRKYYDDIMSALEDDEFAKKSQLTYKLDQVSAAMENSTNC